MYCVRNESNSTGKGGGNLSHESVGGVCIYQVGERDEKADVDANAGRVEGGGGIGSEGY